MRTARAAEPASDADSEEARQFAPKKEAPAVQLAPGQKWDPSQKIKFSAPKAAVQRPGVVFVLDAQLKPEPKKVLLGITDGTTTEVISGEIQPGAAVIVSDSTQAAQTQTATGGFLFGARGGGGRGN
jgi:hypothetical protein